MTKPTMRARQMEQIRATLAAQGWAMEPERGGNEWVHDDFRLVLTLEVISQNMTIRMRPLDKLPVRIGWTGVVHIPTAQPTVPAEVVRRIGSGIVQLTRMIIENDPARS